MMKHFNKIALVASIAMITSAFSAYTVGVDVDARVRAKVDNGVDAHNGDLTIEDSVIKATATVDNVSATVKFTEQGGTVGDADFKGIAFDGIKLTVSDLFGGLLSLEFFDWGYSAGSSYDEGDYILSDISFNGVRAIIKPIDILSIGIAYGISNGNSNSVRIGSGTEAVDEKVGSHGIRLDIGVTGTGFPLNVYYGVVLNNAVRSHQPDVLPSVEFGVALMQLGADIKLYQNYADLGVGITLPYGTFVDKNYGTDEDPEYEFIALVVLSGKAAMLDGLTVNYAVSYSTESTLKGNLDFGFSDMLRVKLGVTWSLGILELTNMVRLTMGENHVAEGDETVVYNPIGVTYEPMITLNFAEGFAVDFLYTLNVADISGAPEGVDSSLSHTIGMNVEAAFGVSNE